MNPSSSPQTLPLFVEAVRIVPDGRVRVASWGPLEEGARDAITRQAELVAPAKLALAHDGTCELRAEVLRSGNADADKLARSALDLGRAWLAGEMPSLRDVSGDGEDLAAALAALPRVWAWDPSDGGGFRIHATAFGESVRLAVNAQSSGAQVTVRGALATPEPAAWDALVHFALECNRRLRLARIGVAPVDEATATVTWDVVTPAGVDLADVLPVAVEAVAFAHAATRRSLRALCHASIAHRYLDARGAPPGRRR